MYKRVTHTYTYIFILRKRASEKQKKNKIYTWIIIKYLIKYFEFSDIIKQD